MSEEPKILEYVPDEFERRPFSAVALFTGVIVVLVALVVASIAVLAWVFGPEVIAHTIERLIFDGGQ